MFIKSLKINNFRNYNNCYIEFSKRINFFLGDNGTGKSNLLEALSLFSYLKSFRGASDSSIIKWNSEGYFAELKFSAAQITKKIKIVCTKNNRSIKKNVSLSGKKINKFSELIGHFVCIIFSPDDMELINGSPAERRKYIDLILSQKNPLYLQSLLDYNKAMKHRNALLKKIKEGLATPADLFPWDLQMQKFAELLISERNNFVEEIQEIFHGKIEEIAGKKENWNIVYRPSVNVEQMKPALEESTARDIRTGRTNKGPHLDKIIFTLNTTEDYKKVYDARQTASQGQKRSLVIALKLLQYEYLKKHLKINPVLLIDDVITELDKTRRYRFIKILHKLGQSFFTTTSLDGFDSYLDEWKEEIQIFHTEDLIS